MNTKICLAGLPRSGTSMMMRMLVEGGVPCEYDNSIRRFQTLRNIYGCFETLNPSLTKCFKAYTQQMLQRVPKDWKIIYIRRNIKARIASWTDVGVPNIEGQNMAQRDEDFANQVYTYQDVLTLDYDEVVADPLKASQQIADFVGGFNVEKASKAVDTKLYIKR